MRLDLPDSRPSRLNPFTEPWRASGGYTTLADTMNSAASSESITIPSSSNRRLYSSACFSRVRPRASRWRRASGCRRNWLHRHAIPSQRCDSRADGVAALKSSLVIMLSLRPVAGLVTGLTGSGEGGANCSHFRTRSSQLLPSFTPIPLAEIDTTPDPSRVGSPHLLRLARSCLVLGMPGCIHA